MTSATDKEIIPRIPSDQLVFETDSLYLSPHPCCPINHPWNLPDIAVEVSRLRNVSLPVLMWTVNENSLRFFGIPKPMDRSRSEAFGSGLARR
jgi:Tat protein secretion system quality control protein TatD with DNase activity